MGQQDYKLIRIRESVHKVFVDSLELDLEKIGGCAEQALLEFAKKRTVHRSKTRGVETKR